MKGWIQRGIFGGLYLALGIAPIVVWSVGARWIIVQTRKFRSGEALLPLPMWGLPPDTLQKVLLSPHDTLPTILIVTSGTPKCQPCDRLLQYVEFFIDQYPGLLRDSAQVYVVVSPPLVSDFAWLKRWKKVARQVVYDRQKYFESRLLPGYPTVFYILPYGYLYAWRSGVPSPQEEFRALATFVRATHVYQEYLNQEIAQWNRRIRGNLP